jgi:oligopeptide transport system permease protein
MQTLFVLNNDYNVASRMLGTPTPKIIVSNILPKILPVIIQSAAFAIPTAISIDATFSYLGYGFVDAEGHITSLGTIISQVMARTDFYVYPMLIIAPLFMISLIAFLFFFVSKILADSLDAKLHRR